MRCGRSVGILRIFVFFVGVLMLFWNIFFLLEECVKIVRIVFWSVCISMMMMVISFIVLFVVGVVRCLCVEIIIVVGVFVWSVWIFWWGWGLFRWLLRKIFGIVICVGIRVFMGCCGGERIGFFGFRCFLLIIMIRNLIF